MPKSDFAITPDIILRAYSVGVFPMAESAEDPNLHWVEPEKRGIIPLDAFHVSTKMRRFVRREEYRVSVDEDFPAVIAACAAPRMDAQETWINGTIRTLYTSLFEAGYCHSVEVRNAEGALVGGLYGLALGGAFFGESMFHLERDCSKLALIHLVARLKAGGFTLLDTQFITDHLRQFGAVEIPKRLYRKLLDAALDQEADFHIWPQVHRAEQVLGGV